MVSKKMKLNRDPLTLAVSSLIPQQRKKHGLSQHDLSVKTGFHRSYIGDLERGVRGLSVKNVSRLAEAFDLSASTFLAMAERRSKRPGKMLEEWLSHIQ